jgi:hypothetical protein
MLGIEKKIDLKKPSWLFDFNYLRKNQLEVMF